MGKVLDRQSIRSELESLMESAENMAAALNAASDRARSVLNSPDPDPATDETDDLPFTQDLVDRIRAEGITISWERSGWWTVGRANVPVERVSMEGLYSIHSPRTRLWLVGVLAGIQAAKGN